MYLKIICVIKEVNYRMSLSDRTWVILRIVRLVLIAIFCFIVAALFAVTIGGLPGVIIGVYVFVILMSAFVMGLIGDLL